MNYYGNTPPWVYHQKINDLKDEISLSENLNEQKITNAVKKLLSVVDYSIISMWCDMNGYYYPIKKDFEKLEKIDALESQIKEIGIEIDRIKYKYGLSWIETNELNSIDAKINERDADVKRYEGADPEKYKKANKLYKSAVTRKKTLFEKREKCENKIAEESKPLIKKQNDKKHQLAKLKEMK